MGARGRARPRDGSLGIFRPKWAKTALHRILKPRGTVLAKPGTDLCWSCVLLRTQWVARKGAGPHRDRDSAASDPKYGHSGPGPGGGPRGFSTETGPEALQTHRAHPVGTSKPQVAFIRNPSVSKNGIQPNFKQLVHTAAKKIDRPRHGGGPREGGQG